MAGREKEIGRLMRDIVNPERNRRYSIMMGKVVAGSVDENAGTCKVVLSSDDEVAPTENVAINAVLENANGFILYPADGSDVWVADLEGKEIYGIIKCSNISKATLLFNAAGGGDRIMLMTSNFFEARIRNYYLHIEDGNVLLKSGGSNLTGTDHLFKFNDGSYGGVPKAGELASKYNAIETRINNMITTLTAGIASGAYVGAPGGAALAAAILAQLGAAITPTTQVMIENADVKHGPHIA